MPKAPGPAARNADLLACGGLVDRDPAGAAVGDVEAGAVRCEHDVARRHEAVEAAQHRPLGDIVDDDGALLAVRHRGDCAGSVQGQRVVLDRAVETGGGSGLALGEEQGSSGEEGAQAGTDMGHEACLSGMRPRPAAWAGRAGGFEIGLRRAGPVRPCIASRRCQRGRSIPRGRRKNAAASGFGGSGRRLQRREVVDDGLHVGLIDRAL